MLELDVLIPINNLDAAKSRLADFLDDEIRKKLVLAMLRDIIDSLQSCSSINSINVVSPDAHVREYVEALGVRHIEDPVDTDLNDVLANVTQQFSNALLILPGDVPLFHRGTLDLIRNKVEGHHPPYVLAVPSYCNGTNALLRNPANVINPKFGSRSFIRHREESERAGVEFVGLDIPELSVDVDSLDDLELVLEKGPNTQTAEVIRFLNK